MSFEEQEQEIERHCLLHRSNEPLTRKYFCLICYPLTENVPDQQFQNFWNWLNRYYRPDTYTAYTVNALPVYCQLFEREPDTSQISHQTTNYLVKLLFSIQFEEQPISLHKLILEIYQLTSQTNYFRQAVSHDLYLIIDLFLSS